MSERIKPMPCFICGELPKVDSFPLMTLLHRGLTCLCPNRHYETSVYYERGKAIEEWNHWVENEGMTEDEDYE